MIWMGCVYITVVTPVSSTAVGTSTTAFLTPTMSVSRPRFKAVPRQKIMQVFNVRNTLDLFLKLFKCFINSITF